MQLLPFLPGKKRAVILCLQGRPPSKKAPRGRLCLNEFFVRRIRTKKRLFREIEFWRNSLGGRLVAPRAKGRKRPIEFFFFALLLLQTLLKSLEKAPQAKEEEGKEEREPSFLQSVSSLSLSLSPARFRTFGERNSPNSPTNKDTLFWQTKQVKPCASKHLRRIPIQTHSPPQVANRILPLPLSPSPPRTKVERGERENPFLKSFPGRK